MARRLLLEGHEVVAYNRTAEKTDQLVKDGATGAYSLPEVVQALSQPRIVWIMLPAGSPVDVHLEQLRELLSPGDIIIDGGNTYYKDDVRRAQFLAERNIQFVDAGCQWRRLGIKKRLLPDAGWRCGGLSLPGTHFQVPRPPQTVTFTAGIRVQGIL